MAPSKVRQEFNVRDCSTGVFSLRPLKREFAIILAVWRRQSKNIHNNARHTFGVKTAFVGSQYSDEFCESMQVYVLFFRETRQNWRNDAFAASSGRFRANGRFHRSRRGVNPLLCAFDRTSLTKWRCFFYRQSNVRWQFRAKTKPLFYYTMFHCFLSFNLPSSFHPFFKRHCSFFRFSEICK